MKWTTAADLRTLKSNERKWCQICNIHLHTHTHFEQAVPTLSCKVQVELQSCLKALNHRIRFARLGVGILREGHSTETFSLINMALISLVISLTNAAITLYSASWKPSLTTDVTHRHTHTPTTPTPISLSRFSHTLLHNSHRLDS